MIKRWITLLHSSESTNYLPWNMFSLKMIIHYEGVLNDVFTKFSFPSFTSSSWIMKECFFSWMNLFWITVQYRKNLKLEKQFEQFDSIVRTFESIGSRFMIVHIDYWYNDEISFYWIQLPNIWSFITWNTWNICTPELLYDIQALKEWFVFYVEIKQYKLVFLRNTKITRLFQGKEFSLKIFTR